MLRVGICDNDRNLVAQLEEILLQLGALTNIQLEIDSFFDGQELVRHYEGGNRFDLLFLDIEMEKMSGIGAATKIREWDQHVLIIFCSSYESYFMELFEVEPFRFLKKPLNLPDVRNVFEKAYHKILRQGRYFEYAFNKEIIRLPLLDIYYFESKGRRIYIHTTEGIQQFNGQLSKIEKQLEANSLSFLRIHQSYLINFQQIKVLSYTHAILQNGEKLPIGPKRQKEIRSQYLHLLEE